MKPLSLDIAGLNSFRRKQTVDFERLLDHGIFGIFGPTGSGKSSILDAITLALYGKVKRAGNGKTGIINVREKLCTVSFTFELGTDGGRQRYTIERVLSRASGRPDGVQTKKARLIEYEGDQPVVTADKQSEIDDRMLELLGIDYQEFMSAVVLPQGAFADFLGLKPAERARALQRLFGLHEFGQRLQTRLKSVSDELRRGKAAIEGHLAELRLYDDEAVSATAVRLSAAELADRAARDAARRCESECDAGEKLMALCSEREQLRLAEAERPQKQSELDSARREVDQAERSIAVASAIQAFEGASERALAAEQEHRSALERHAVAEAALAHARERQMRADSLYRSDHDRLQGEITALAEIVAIDERLRNDAVRIVELRANATLLETDLLAHQERAGSARSRIVSSEAALIDITARRAGLAVPYDLLEELNALRNTDGQICEREAYLGQQEQELELFRRATSDAENMLAGRQAELEKSARDLALARAAVVVSRSAVERSELDRGRLRERLLAMQALLDRVCRDEEECRRHETNCAQLRERLQEQEAAWVNVTHRVHNARERKLELTERRREASDRLQEGRQRLSMATLAPLLRDGEPCPLCGALEHPGSTELEADGSQELAALEAEECEVATALEQALEEMAVCGQTIAEVEAEKKNLIETLQRDEQDLSVVRIRVRDGLVAAGDERGLASSADFERYVAELSILWSRAGERAAEARERLSSEEGRIELLGSENNRLAAACAKLGGDIDGRREQITTRERSVEELRSALGEARADLARRAGGRSSAQIEEELQRVQDLRQAAEHLREASENEQEKVTAARSEFDGLRELVGDAQRRHDQALTIVVQLEGGMRIGRDDLETRLASICTVEERGRDLSRLVEERRTHREALASERVEADAAYTAAVANEKGERTSVEHLSAAVSRDLADRARLEGACNAALRTFGFASIADALGARIPQDQLAELRRRAVELDEELRRSAERIRELDADLAGRVITDAELDALRSARNEASQALERAIGECASARSEHATAVDRNTEFHRVADDNAEAIERERTVQRLAGYLQGDAFVNFLAEEKLGDVCRRASLLLQELTGGRLELLARSNDGFMIRDLGNGAAERAPGSLSGGETFLVSLSLALALSDTIQLGRAPLEFFFLDEGFGSLDDELLEVVVDALERLRSHRRTIGLITHVAMLRERIPRRLVVTPAGERSGSTIAYEVG